MMNYLEALEILKKEFSALTFGIEEVDILDSTNRILAEDVIADVDLPPFDNSAMDGYAVKFSGNSEWNIVGEILAGNFSNINLSENDAILVATGSKLPVNVDSVIPIEDVEVNGNKLKLKENATFKKGMNVRLKGDDLSKGEVALSRFTKIGAKEMAVLASCGKDRLKVFRKLRVAIFSTGNELIPINEKPAGDKLRLSNIYSLFAAIKESYCIPINLGFSKDDRELISQKIKSALSMNIDMLITTGGISVGKYDFLKEVFEEHQIKEKFWRVNIKPGKPFYFGIYGEDNKRILVFGLPGNPVSCLVNFEVFIKPAIESLFNQKPFNIIEAVLQNDLKKRDGKRHFACGILIKENNQWKVSSYFSQSSGNLIEMSRANCLIVIEEERRNPTKGEIVECILI